MAKYNAIYEGRLPHGMYNKIISNSKVTYPQGYMHVLLNFIHKIYRKIIDSVA